MKAVKTQRPFTEKIPRAWSQGTGCKVIDPVTNDQEMFEDEYFYFGILRGAGDMMKRSMVNGWDYYFCDHAYLDAGHDGADPWYRITKNSQVNSVLRDRPADRYENNFKHDIKPWRRSGSKIIVCPPTGAIEWFFDAQDWLNTTVETLKQHTDREIVVRDKPMDPQVSTRAGITQLVGFNKKTIDKPLHEDLEDAHAVVTFNSNVGVKAICEGIPVICGPECAAYPLANKFEDVENFKFEDRKPWLHNLAYSQFRLSEIQSGFAYQTLIS
jgi:hypothetical protein